MKSLILVFTVCIALCYVLPGELPAQVTPALTLYDNQGTPYWNPDNSTLFSASPGVVFRMELTGAPSAPFGLFMSLKSTPFPKNIVPPPLFIMWPIWPGS